MNKIHYNEIEKKSERVGETVHNMYVKSVASLKIQNWFFLSTIYRFLWINRMNYFTNTYIT